MRAGLSPKFQAQIFHTIKRINKLSNCGVDIFSVILGEKYYDDKQVLSHFRYLNKHTKLPLLLHLQMMFRDQNLKY